MVFYAWQHIGLFTPRGHKHMTDAFHYGITTATGIPHLCYKLTGPLLCMWSILDRNIMQFSITGTWI